MPRPFPGVLCVTVVMLALAGCPPSHGAEDAGRPDGSARDGSVADGGISEREDSGLADSGIQDGGAQDGGAADGGAEDGGVAPRTCARNGSALLVEPVGWLNSGLEWPQVAGSAYPPTGVSTRVALGQREFISLPFVARSTEAVSLLVAPDGLLATAYEGFYYTVSECPGDFRAANNSPAVRVDEPTLGSSCRGNYVGKRDQRLYTTDDLPGQCRVIPGRRYYLNIIQGDPSSILSGESLCPSERCSFIGQFRG